MELTDEEYLQVIQFVDGGMNKEQHTAFKNMLSHNEQLSDEVELYRDIVALGASAEQKLTTTSFSIDEKMIQNEMSLILRQAREHWETRYENMLKLKYGIPQSTVKNIKTHPQARIPKMATWLKVSIAAVLLGIISISITWYIKKNKDVESLAGRDTPNKVKKVDQAKTPEANNTVLTTKDQKNKNKPAAQNESVVPVAHGGEVRGERGSKFLNLEKSNALFSDYFEPDLAPPNKSGPLEAALTSYENGKYKEAIKGFEDIDLGPATRGNEANSLQRVRLYSNYYKGISYLATGNTENAIAALKNAQGTDQETLNGAQWFLALAYLKNGQADETRRLLQLVERDALAIKYHQKAKLLNKRLRGK